MQPTHQHPDASAVVEFPLAESTVALAARLRDARRAYSTRRVELSHATALVRHLAPKSGDLVLARVEQIGQHPKLECPAGRRQQMYAGDEIIVAYGNRYAPDQFDAVVPDHLEGCDLVAGGGIAATMRAKHASMKSPTRIQPVGLLADAAGRVLNLHDYALGRCAAPRASCPVVVIVGTSMNAGKTTTAAKLIRGLHRAGLRVGAAKITGTGSGADIWSMVDAGARRALDFTDMGFATTAGMDTQRLEAAGIDLIGHASNGSDIVVIEIADGLFQTETRALLLSPRLRPLIDTLVLAAGDAMGAAFGAQWLADAGLPLKFIAGCVGSSPLGRREAATATGLHVATLDELADPVGAPRLCLGAQRAPLLSAVG